MTNVPGAIIETSVGEPGELTQPFRSQANNEFLKFRIVLDMRKGMKLISVLLILLYLPPLLTGPFLLKTLINLFIMDRPI